MTDSRAAYDPDRLPWLDRGTQAAPQARALGSAAAVGAAGRRCWSPACPTGSACKASREPDDIRRPRSRPRPRRRRSSCPSRRSSQPPAVEVRPAPMPDVQAGGRAGAGPDSAGRTGAQSQGRAVSRRASAQAEGAGRYRARLALERRQAKKTRGRAAPGAAAGLAGSRIGRAPTAEWSGSAPSAAGARPSRAGAKIVRVYPGMRRLEGGGRAGPSLRNGRTFYRLQFGTTSQAHSEVLCQRMRVIGQSCVVDRPAGDGRGDAMSDFRSSYDDSELPWLEAVDDEDGPRGVSARKMLAALLVVLAAVAIVAGDLLLARPPGPGRDRRARADPRRARAVQGQADRSRRARRRRRKRAPRSRPAPARTATPSST